MDSPSFAPGERISHPDLGAGVVIDVAREGYLLISTRVDPKTLGMSISG